MIEELKRVARAALHSKVLYAALGLAIAFILVVAIAGCSESENDKEAKVRKEHPAFQAHNYIERQIFNHRLEISDDPSTVLFCTTYPFDRPPKVNIIAGKLVSGTKRPDPAFFEAEHGSTGTERQDAQGMYGASVPYRFGFTPGGQYVDFTDLPTECTTEAQSTKQTSVGAVVVKNEELTEAAHQAQAVLRAGTINTHGQFQGYQPEARKKAQEIMDNAVARSK